MHQSVRNSLRCFMNIRESLPNGREGAGQRGLLYVPAQIAAHGSTAKARGEAQPSHSIISTTGAIPLRDRLDLAGAPPPPSYSS